MRVHSEHQARTCGSVSMSFPEQLVYMPFRCIRERAFMLLELSQNSCQIVEWNIQREELVALRLESV
jgi:hypothetical protein